MKTPSVAFWLCASAVLGGWTASCLNGTVQPIGWQGAGRLQGLPEPLTDSGGAMIDAGVDADSGIDAGPDGGEGTGSPDGAPEG